MEYPNSKLIDICDYKFPRVEVVFGGKHESRENEIIDVAEFIAPKGVKARGKRITTFETKSIRWIEPILVDEPESTIESEVETEEVEFVEESEVITNTNASFSEEMSENLVETENILESNLQEEKPIKEIVFEIIKPKEEEIELEITNSEPKKTIKKKSKDDDPEIKQMSLF